MIDCRADFWPGTPIRRNGIFVALAGAFVLTAGAQEYEVPRTIAGQPDLQGVWQAVNTAVWDIQDHSAEYGVPAGQGVVVGNDLPYQPWAWSNADRIARTATVWIRKLIARW